MSENNQAGKIPVIPGDKSVTIELTPMFMQRIQILTSYLVNMYGQDKFMLFVKKVQEENHEPESDLERHIQTLSALMVEFETKAQEQGKINWLSPEEASDYIKNNPILGPLINNINGN